VGPAYFCAARTDGGALKLSSRSAIGPRVPFDPARVPVYYGWVVVGAATFGILASIPGQTMGVSVFTDPLLAATGLSRLGLSNAYLVGTLTSAALLPGAGRLLDRVGVRVGAMAAALGLGLVLLALSGVETLIEAVRWLGSSASFVVIAALFVGLRFTGQGVLTLASRTMVARWFERRRGLAASVSGLFVAFGFAIAPRVLDAWVSRAGVSLAYQELALLEIVGVAGIVFVLFREDPASAGLRIDGATEEASGPADPAGPPATRAEALRSRAFWIPTLALSLQGMVVTGVTFHIVDLGAEGGLDRLAAVGLFVPMAVVSAISEAIGGWLSDRIEVRRLLQLFLAAMAVGYLACAQLGTPVGYATAAGALGVAGGLFSVLTTIALPRFFGLRHLGTISGASMTGIVVGSALGPSLLAASRAFSGSYAAALGAAALVALAIGLWTLTPLHPADVECARAR